MKTNFVDTDVIEAPADLAKGNGKSGRAVWDERGNSIWEWQTQPGVYSRNVSAEQLETLQARQLRIDEVSSGLQGIWIERPRYRAA